MINNDWERFGDEIRRTIQNAVDSRDFSRLNQTISDTVNQAVDNVSRGIRNGGWYRDNPMDGRWDAGMPGGQAAPGQDAYQYGRTEAGLNPGRRGLFLNGSATKIGGAFLAATGYIFGTSTVIMLLIAVAAGAAGGWGSGLAAGAAGLGIFALIFGWMAGKGTGMVCSVGRFRKYVSVLRDREYCDVKELAQNTGRSVKAVVKDLKKMIQKGWFRQGHLDEQESCLMVSDEAYRQYTGLMERLSREKAEREAAAEKERQEYSKLSPEVQKIVRAGDEYVRKIREANDAIPGEEISAKISRMEMLVDRIFDRVEQNPESVDDIRKLMEYYLPTTIKLLEAYEDLDAQPVQGENIISSKKEIEKTLDTLNTAFEKLLDDLFQDTAWDVSSDISVLNTMLAQEGLTEDGLTGKKKK